MLAGQENLSEALLVNGSLHVPFSGSVECRIQNLFQIMFICWTFNHVIFPEQIGSTFKIKVHL